MPIERRSPSEFVEAAVRLPGVAGALIASDDGLLIAANLPPALSAEKLAAFLPSSFAKIKEMGQELGLGHLSEVRFDFQGNLWIIARTGNAYFAAGGRGGEPLPEAALKSLRSELTQLTS